MMDKNAERVRRAVALLSEVREELMYPGMRSGYLRGDAALAGLRCGMMRLQLEDFLESKGESRELEPETLEQVLKSRMCENSGG